MMEQIASRIVCHIEEVYVLEKGEKEILQFGIQAFCEIVINIIASFIILWQMKMIQEGIFFFMMFIPVRIYSGGYHSDTYFRCFILSCLTLIGIMRACVCIIISNAVFVALIAILSLLVWTVGPVITENRSVSDKEYRKFSRNLKSALIIEVIIAVGLYWIQATRYLAIMFLSLLLIFITLIVGRIKYKRCQAQK